MCYKASFEASFVDLGCLDKHSFSTRLLENSRDHNSIAWFSVNSHKSSPLGLISRLAVIVPWAVLNVFKVVKFVAMTKLIVNYYK